MRTLWQDLRYGLRMLRRSPGFTAVAVLALALGIGANTAIFSVVNAVLLRSLPYQNPDRIVWLWGNSPRMGAFTVSAPDFLDWKDQNQVFEHTAAFQYRSFNLTGEGEPEHIWGSMVSSGLFLTLGVQPILGRTFLPEEDQAGGKPVVVVSHGLWRRRFGSDPKLLGKALTLSGNDFTVVGIMPPGFRFPIGHFPIQPDLWVPLVLDISKMGRGNRFLFVLARLKPGVTLEQARADMNTIARRIEQQYPSTNADWGVKLVPLHEQVVGRVRLGLLVLFGAVAFVLLIACANVANLLLARAARRQKEIAVRTALGASRFRIIQQLLTESLLLAVLGGTLGLLLAWWGTTLLAALSPSDLPRLKEIRVDGKVLGFVLFISMLTGVVFGLAPALQASRPNLNESLKEGGRSSTGGARHNRMQNLLVTSEVALALLLLIGAGLMVQSFIHLQRVDAGFNAEKVLTMQVTLPNSKYPEQRHQAAFAHQLLQRVEALPGVISAGAVTALPLGGDDVRAGFTIAGRPDPAPGQVYHAYEHRITPSYFHAMSIPLLKGRYLTDLDVEGAPKVVVISERLARQYWSDEDPIGKRLTLLWEKPNSREIVGVVGSVRHSRLDAEPKPELYLPYYQNSLPFFTLTVRTSGDPLSLAAAVRSQVLAVDKDQPVFNVRTMQQLVSRSVAQPRLYTLLLGIFAVVALVLAVVGLYGVISYSVNQRTHEIGIRMALGAQPSDVLKLVVRQGMILVLLGLILGLTAALALTRVMSSLLYEVRATDPVIFVSVSLLLVGVALLASYIPARRATKVDPVVALRYE